MTNNKFANVCTVFLSAFVLTMICGWFGLVDGTGWALGLYTKAARHSTTTAELLWHAIWAGMFFIIGMHFLLSSRSSRVTKYKKR